MIFQAPSFWYTPLRGPLKALIPWASLYTSLQRWHTARSLPQTRAVGIPVISVGNLVVGGAGKTPVCLFLARWFQNQGWHPHLVTRGYGCTQQAPFLKVNTEHHTVHDVGDEAWLLAQTAPTWVAPQRFLAAQQAEAEGAHILILDDAHQHHSVHKDLSILVVNEAQGFGNGHVLPAGPLREDLHTGLQRAQLMWWIGDCQHHMPPRTSVEIIRSTYDFSEDDKVSLQGKRWVAFAGLGFPEKFFSALRACGADVAQTISFPDHHAYSPKNMADLQQCAQNHNALLITTPKDAVKWPASLQKKLRIIEPSMYVQDMTPLGRWVQHFKKTMPPSAQA